jgi:hypothetical protein
MAPKYRHYNETKQKYHLCMVSSSELQHEFLHIANLSLYILKDLYALRCETHKINQFRNAILFMVSNNRRILGLMEDVQTNQVWKILDIIEEGMMT